MPLGNLGATGGPGGGGSVGAASTWTTVIKPSDTSRTASPGSTADPHLTTAELATGTAYLIRGRVYVSTSATPDFVFTAANDQAPADNFGFWRISEPDLDGPGRIVSPSTWTEETITGITHMMLEFEFRLDDGEDTAWVFAWGQGTSDAGATVVKKGSYIEYAPVA